MKIEGQLAVMARNGRSEDAPGETRQGWIECAEATLRTSTGLRVGLESVECGWVLPGEGAMLRTPQHLVWIACSDSRRSYELLAAAGADPTQKPFDLSLGYPLRRMLALTVGAFVVIAAVLLALPGTGMRSASGVAVLLLSLGAACALMALSRREVRVSAEGVEVQRGFTRWSAPIEAVQAFKVDAFKFVLHRHKGAALTLWEASPTADTTDAGDAAELAVRTRQARILNERLARLRSARSKGAKDAAP